MIRTSYNDIIVKIFFEGKEIQKVYKQGIQVFPDQAFDKFFWLKVFDEDDQKTYYYHCTQTSVVYQEGSTDVIKEIYYFTGQKQENHPGEDQQIYELLNDQVKITGQEYSENDFESFVDKSPNEVIAMTQTYQEKIIVGKTEGLQPDDYVNDNLVVEYDSSKVDTVLDYHGLKLSDFSGFTNEYKYMMDWNKAYSKITSRGLGFIKIENTDTNDITIKYICWSGYNLAQMFISDSVNDIQTVINDNGSTYLYQIKGFTNIIKCYGGYGDWSSGYTPDATFGSSQPKKIWKITIPANTTYYFCGLWYTNLNKTADSKDYSWSQIMMSIFYNKSVNIQADGNFLNHKYISDKINTESVGLVSYKFAYAIVKNDLNKKVYQTNCKYIISREELESVTVNNVMIIPAKSLGWKLLTNDEWKKYIPFKTTYVWYLSISHWKNINKSLWGLLNITEPKDLRIYRGDDSEDNIYFDTGKFSTRINIVNHEDYITTFMMNGNDGVEYTYKNKVMLKDFNYYNSLANDPADQNFLGNVSGLYLNAYEYENVLPDGSFYFYEFKIVDSNTGDIVKRIVPSNDRTKLWECVSGKFIEPCRTVSDEANLPVLLDNLKLGVETKDGLGNKIEDWLIY